MGPTAAAPILVVEDNPITRKMLRVSLEAEGFAVLEAADGAAALDLAKQQKPGLVIQDFVLPDMNGDELFDRLRALDPGRAMPIVLLSGLTSQTEALQHRVRFDAVLTKPMEPSKLVDVVRLMLGESDQTAPLSKNKRILVVDDLSTNRKLTRLQLELAGYAVTTAESVEDALAIARKNPPDAIFSDVLMPGLDGFQLCMAVRRDAALAHLPIVLVSSAYTEQADRQLALDAGATALVTRTAKLEEALAALSAATSAGAPPAPPLQSGVDPQYVMSLRRQVARQLATGQQEAERSALQAAVMSLLSSLARVIADPSAATGILGDVLVHCLDAAGLSTGLLYLQTSEGLALHAATGVLPAARSDAQSFFGHKELFDAQRSSEPVAFEAATTKSAAAKAVLGSLQHRAALIVPFVVLGRHYGSLLLSSDRHDLTSTSWTTFAHALAVQFGQVVALGRAMVESEALVRTACEASPNGMIMVDAAGRIVLANLQAAGIFGYDKSELHGRPLEDLLPARMRSAHVGHRHSFLQHPEVRPMGARRDLYVLHKSGREIPVEIGLAPVKRGDETFVIASIIDITERKQSEQKMAEAAGRIQALMDHAHDGINVLTPAGMILETNPRMAEILGVPRSEIVGRHISAFLPKDQQAPLDGFGRAVADGAGVVRDVHLVRGNGAVAIVDFSIASVKVGDQQLVLSIGRDVTEERALERQFLQAQKMEAVGRLAGGVAHDFNNVLTAILGHVDLLKEDGPDESVRSGLDEIERAGHRAAGLTRQLLAFSRQQVLQPRIIEPNQVIADLEKMLLRLIGEDVALNTALAPAIGNVLIDPGQFEQIILNLVVNARDAMPTGGTIRIETGEAPLTAADLATAAQGVQPGVFTVVRVHDTGWGMTMETQARIFEPFFTTKAPGKGTGLGLSTVYGIVRQSGGHVTVASEPGRGSTFNVFLPSVNAPAHEVVADIGTRGAAGTETILLAEDDEMLRPLAKAVLKKLGYNVLTAANAGEALRLARVHHGPIHLLITDVVMPGASGRELAAKLEHLRPGHRVLYMSGYTDDAIVRHGVLESHIEFLAKPFTPAQLATKVRHVLDLA